MKASFLKEVVGFFDPMQSLDEAHRDWYVDRPDSPEEEIKVYLLNNSTDTKILFSGHRGSGKSSTLSKLASDAEIVKNFLVVKFSIKDELNVADLSYTDLLVAIGHRLYEEGKGWISKTLNDDLDKWSAEVSQVTTKKDVAEAKVEAGIAAWFVKAKGMLKTGFEDKREFRLKFEPRVPQLIQFINRIIAAIETNSEASAREVLVILEDLDKPTVDIALDLFAVKGTVLVEPRCKIIFTVPTSLLYSGQFNVAKQAFSEQFMLPNFKIKEAKGERSEPGWARMREVVEKRLERQLIESRALDLAVEMSGGVVRELVRIIEGAATRAIVRKANAIKHEHVEQAVEKLRTVYSFSLTRQDYIDILRRVQETHKLIYPDEKPLLDLLHNLFILQYPNGPGWYGVNPIVHQLIGV